MSNNSQEDWDLIIQPERSLLDINLKEVWRYRDLLFLFVKRDVTTVYKQTILGPVWFFVQPILTSLTFILVFGNIAQLSTDGIPMELFYMSGVILWSYFSTCVVSISSTFIANASIFGKVYFPRLVNPLSVVISNVIKFGIQLIPFLAIWVYYLIKGEIEMNWYIVMFPLLVIQIAILSLGIGLVISSLTTKYRDLNFLVAFGLQLLMYASSVINPLSEAPEKYRLFLELNPMTWIIEVFRYGFMGHGYISAYGIAYSWGFAFAVLGIGIVLFNKVERSFMDTV